MDKRKKMSKSQAQLIFDIIDSVPCTTDKAATDLFNVLEDLYGHFCG